ncbi:MAG TPA: SDR family oxidoreductase, partial [Gammaproteobacteria bacterium]|nr:SDR family oxidoreductase [Gammaproteobacteria bacterium]
GLDALAKAQALEWAEQGIRVNVVSPGVVPVERTEAVLEGVKEAWMPHIPLRRYGLPADIASMVLFLASEQASWITGQSFIVDGGMSCRMDMPSRGRMVAPTE